MSIVISLNPFLSEPRRLRAASRPVADTPLIWKARYGEWRTVKALLAYKVDVNAKDWRGDTAWCTLLTLHKRTWSRTPLVGSQRQRQR